jgi:hypothetical protein
MISFIMFIIVLGIALFKKDLMRKSAVGYTSLLLFSLSFSYIIGFCSSSLQNVIILMASVQIFICILCLTTYSFFLMRNKISWCWSMTFVLVGSGTMVTIFINFLDSTKDNWAEKLIWTLLFAIFYSIYLLFDI